MILNRGSKKVSCNFYFSGKFFWMYEFLNNWDILLDSWWEASVISSTNAIIEWEFFLIIYSLVPCKVISGS